MPYEKDVNEKESYWCPKWYWPFAVCTRTVKKHKWCYQFAWVTETGWGLWSNLEGCEGGKLYSWTEPSFNFFGTHHYPAGEMCFDSPRSSEGVCDASREGMLASGLTKSRPGIANLEIDTSEIASQVAETGSFDFSGENAGLCRKGVWSWKRVRHEQEVIVSAVLNAVTAQWVVEGVPLSAPSGTVSIAASCRYPFPLPNGRFENRIVQIGYEIGGSATESTIKLRNRAEDGCYGVSIGLQAFLNGAYSSSTFTSARFIGETCDFDPEKYKEMAACLIQLRDAVRQKLKFKPPKPGEPVIIVSDEIWRWAQGANKETIGYLLEIMRDALQDDPHTYLQAMRELQIETGMNDLSGWLRIGAPQQEHELTATKRPNAVLVAGVAIGAAFLIGKFIRSRKNAADR